ncbi:hypothetical protein [Candidatus Tisiphia endosymbiont of Melanophora roralis]|uniref:hypothetical protein n=1 Tax=Candidatus Tisiphia endosymbiont of Melanophora roralis TaxID=3066261 RepID=UPI001E7EF49B|nr:MAG: hypothetical protein LF884_07505 [Rickettsia endosymbiont of Cimex lectularius]
MDRKSKKESSSIISQQSIISTQSSSSSTNLPSSSSAEVFHSTPMNPLLVTKKHKSYIYKFLEHLFKIDMSQDALVDIIINEDINDNQILIVGRPKLLGSSTKQMRHVTPYAFIEKAIKEMVVAKKEQSDYMAYMENILEAIKPIISTKDGICLTTEQHSKLVANSTLQIEEQEIFKLSTTSREYYLIYDDALITQFINCNDFSQNEKDKAKTDFSSKFSKYITYGIRYLTEVILDANDLNTITMTCEGIARIILTLFNQDKYAAFPDEGNSLLEEIRVYKNKDDAKKAATLKLEQQEYTIKSHTEITKYPVLQYDERIRIVNNEGSIVKRAAKALDIINSLISGKLNIHHITEEMHKYQDQYNTKYNFNVKIGGVNPTNSQYNTKIDFDNNLHNIFQFYVAKHLYSVFDFKPLETKVLAPRQKGEAHNTIAVYPSASGTTTAKYSIQEGKLYRELQYNSRKGYNDNAIFRSNMDNNTIKDILQKKVTTHIIISLIPFKGLKTGCTINDSQEGMKEIFNAFLKLVQNDYKNTKDCHGKTITLDNQWKEQINSEYVKYNESIDR